MGSLLYGVVLQLRTYYFCIENPDYYCPPENHELFTQIIHIIIGFIYCLIIEFIIWGIKNFRLGVKTVINFFKDNY